MLKLSQSHQSKQIGIKQVDALAKTCQESLSFVLALNEACPMVRTFRRVIERWDKKRTFTLVDINDKNQLTKRISQDLQNSPWSVLLVDPQGNKWFGPEAIPKILMHLPFGKVAAVLYILPGTIWLTRNTYRLFSRNREMFSKAQKQPS